MKILHIKNFKKFFLVTLLVLVLVPVFTFAQEQVPNPVNPDPIIPKCGTLVDGKIRECGYYDLFELINNIIKWIITISVPVSAGVLAWAGFLYLTTAVADERSKAKKMIQNVFIGLACILGAWVIVGSITNALLKNPNAIPVDVKVK